MLLKDIIKPENKEITSYVMKNLVFWLCERYPENEFSLEKLMYWVRRALRMLHESIKVNFLPYYMIPGRNLLKPLTAERKQALLGRIACLIENPWLLLRCKKMDMGVTLLDMHLLDAWQQDQDFREKLLFEHLLIQLQLMHRPEEHPKTAEAAINRMYHIENILKATVSKLSYVMYYIAQECEVEDTL